MKSLDPWKREENTRFGCGSGASSKDGAQQRGIEYHRRVFNLLTMHVSIAMPGCRLLVEPWYKNLVTHKLRSPDTVIIDDAASLAYVIEVKLNWKNGRDTKLIDEYLPIVKSAEKVDKVRPLLITANLRGYQHPPLLGLKQFSDCLGWTPGKPTPLMLLLK